MLSIESAQCSENERTRNAPEAGAARLDGGDNLVDIVADDAEAHVLGVLLDDCGVLPPVSAAAAREVAEQRRGRTATERRLGGCRHHVGLVEDDELEAESGLEEVSVIPSLERQTTHRAHPADPCMRVLAKFLICSRTTSMPRSSEALSCGRCLSVRYCFEVKTGRRTSRQLLRMMDGSP